MKRTMILILPEQLSLFSHKFSLISTKKTMKPNVLLRVNYSQLMLLIQQFDSDFDSDFTDSNFNSDFADSDFDSNFANSNFDSSNFD